MVTVITLFQYNLTPLVKGASSRSVHLEKFSPKFSSSATAIRAKRKWSLGVNILHHCASLLFYS